MAKIINHTEDNIKKNYENFVFEETQIYRKNSEDLNCKRHFKVFNKFNIIPKFCFSCLRLNKSKNIDLIKLFNFDNMNTK